MGLRTIQLQRLIPGIRAKRYNRGIGSLLSEQDTCGEMQMPNILHDNSEFPCGGALYKPASAVYGGPPLLPPRRLFCSHKK